MLFRKVASVKEAAQILLEELQNSLDTNSKVLWLLCGGSNIQTEADIFKQLTGDLSKLSVTLTDERFGPVGHPDSNFFLLQQAGFDFSKVSAHSVLDDSLGSLEATVANFGRTIGSLFAGAGVIIGQFGMGPDGHTAGILPNSSAASELDELAVGYEAPNFVRITMTFKAIKMVDKAYLVAFGEDKTEALRNLRDKDLSLVDQPAQIFKQLKKAYIVNNVIGDEG